jgi:peptide chain release factor subunit 1
MDSEDELEVERAKLKKVVKMLDTLAGDGTSMISLIMPPGDQISRVVHMLDKEEGTATNIKSRVNRQSVLDAIVRTRQRLKTYSKVPPNGLFVFCGTATDANGKEKSISISFEPFVAINTSLYICDKRFHTDQLKGLMEDKEKFGFIIVDGEGALYGTVQGSAKVVLHKFDVDLPKKHNKGGQSSVRFARLRTEARHNYVRKVAENANEIFIQGGELIVNSIIIAGSADVKLELMQADLFDYRLKKIILKLIDVAYGGINGFSEAIKKSEGDLKNVRFVQEGKILQEFFDSITQNTEKVSYGINEVIKLLEMGAVKKIIVCESINYIRRTLMNKENKEETKIAYVNPDQDRAVESKWMTSDEIDFLEWLAENYKKYGIVLSIVTANTDLGSQFMKGFGGVGAILRYKVNMDLLDEDIGMETTKADDTNDNPKSAYEAYEDDFI